MPRDSLISTARPAARAALLRGLQAVSEAWARLQLRRRAAALAFLARQLSFYRVPGERDSCPACGAAPLELLEPLPFTRTIAPGWRVGFIAGCPRCGVVFANPLPEGIETAGGPSHSGDNDQSGADEHEAAATAAGITALFAPISTELDVRHPPLGATALDFGCGAGSMLDTLQDLGWRTVGMDSTNRGAFIRHREMTALPTWPRFDLVLLHHMLERNGDPLSALRQIAAATHTGGYLLISVPDLADAHEHGDLAYCIESERHVLAYTTGSLEWLCARAGFRVVSSERAGGARQRQRVVLARREDGRWPLPRAPLRNARAALDRYYARFPEVRPPYLKAPIRLRAALLNLHWRGAGQPQLGPDAVPEENRSAAIMSRSATGETAENSATQTPE